MTIREQDKEQAEGGRVAKRMGWVAQHRLNRIRPSRA